MGNRTKLLKPHVRQTILDYIAKGNYISTACKAAGVCPETYCNWQNKAEAATSSDDIYYQFFQELKTAEAQNIAHNIENIQTASDKDARNWTASAWLLERKYPAEYGKRLELEVGPSKVLLALQQQAKLEYVTTEEIDTSESDRLLIGEAP